MTRAFLRLATLGIVHAAVTVTLPKNASFLVEVMKLDGSSDTYKLPVCCDLRVAAADLCAVASQPEEAAACLVQFLPDLAARRDSALAEGLLELPVVITYGGNATDATRTARPASNRSADVTAHNVSHRVPRHHLTINHNAPFFSHSRR